MGSTPRTPRSLRETKEEREKALQEFAKKNPLATNRAAKQHLVQLFGHASGTSHVSAVMRLARERHETGRRTKGDVPAIPEVGPRGGDMRPDGQQSIAAAIASEMREAGIRMVRVNDNGTFDAEFRARMPKPGPATG